MTIPYVYENRNVRCYRCGYQSSKMILEADHAEYGESYGDDDKVCWRCFSGERFSRREFCNVWRR